ncbi:hypothetical protein RB597_007837 [Gaeumannomyces tritici]
MTCSKAFNPDHDIPNLGGKVILVTGGNNGLGLETVRQLARHGPAHIFLASRSLAKAEEAIKDVHSSSPEAAGTSISTLQLDLASFASIKAAARAFTAASDRLDILINNAGIMCTPEGLTQDGYEMQFGTNHMGHALLTQLLLPTLKQTAAAAPGSDVRVVFLSSALESGAPVGTYKTDELKTTMAATSTMDRYSVSKLANVHYASALAAGNPDLRVASVHPGVIRTGLQGPMINGSGPLLKGVMNLASNFLTTVEKGVRNSLWAATAAEVESGAYYRPVGVGGKGSKLSRDAKQRDVLWEWTQKELHRICLAEGSWGTFFISCEANGAAPCC